MIDLVMKPPEKNTGNLEMLHCKDSRLFPFFFFFYDYRAKLLIHNSPIVQASAMRAFKMSVLY